MWKTPARGMVTVIPIRVLEGELICLPLVLQKFREYKTRTKDSE